MADNDPESSTQAGMPALECDLVMKGGITSGLVYPKAVVRVARDYRIRDIGGTSIGAIAAVLTAAAEYWRRTSPDAAAQQRAIQTLMNGLPDNPTENELVDYLGKAETDLIGNPNAPARGFAGLYRIPQEVGADLLGKFQPQMWTRGLFDFATGLMACSNVVSRVAFFLFRQFVILRTILALGFILLALSFRANPTHGMRLMGAALIIGCIAFLILGVVRLVRGDATSRRNNLRTIAITVGAIAVAALVYVLLPSRPDLSSIWERIKGLPGNLFSRPDFGALRWWSMVGILAIGGGSVIWTYRSGKLPGWWRSALLAAVPMAIFTAVCIYYADQAGTIEWLRATLWDAPSIRNLTLAVLGGLAIVLGMPILRDFFLRYTGGPTRVNKATLRTILNALFLLALLIYTLVMLNETRDAVHALVTGDLDAVPNAEHPAYEALRSPDLMGAIAGGAILGWCLGTIVALLYNILVAIPDNFNGICTGLGSGLGLSRRKNNALINWLTDKIDVVAGHLDEMPTTTAPDTRPHLTVEDLKAHDIKLEALTSDLTRGVPLTLPDGLKNYRFKPDEFRQFFPESVVRQMCGTARGNTLEEFDIDTVPVIVIARMSMSFPVLFSTVPVYYRDPLTGRISDETHALSDGGIVSNFPIHLFDRALSPRPTFAIDLVDKNTSIPSMMNDQFAMSPILGGNRRGLTQDQPMATALVPDPPPGKLSALASGILNTARGWMDRSQATLPGYKERIVGIHLYNKEGGLNLNMDLATIDRLANRGLFGMHRFLDVWHPDLQADSEWHQHRWLRYLILMRGIENYRQEWARAYACGDPPVHDPSIKAMVSQEVPLSTPYPIPQPGLAVAQEMARRFDRFATDPEPLAGNDTGTTPDCTAFGTPLPDGAFDSVTELKDREPRLLMIPPFD